MAAEAYLLFSSSVLQIADIQRFRAIRKTATGGQDAREGAQKMKL